MFVELQTETETQQRSNWSSNWNWNWSCSRVCLTLRLSAWSTSKSFCYKFSGSLEQSHQTAVATFNCQTQLTQIRSKKNG